MRITTIFVLIGAIFVLGCTPQAEQGASPEPPGPAVIVGREASVDGDRATAWIELESGEPTGTEPWIALGELADEYPGTPVYELYYTRLNPPDSERHIIYWWTPAKEQVQLMLGEASGSMGTSLVVGMVPSADREYIHAVATGEESLPVFLKPAGVSYTDAELDALDAAGVAEAYFASGNQEVEHWLSAPHVQKSPETDPWKVGDIERMWGARDLIVDPLGPARLENVQGSEWPEQLAFDVTYSSPTISMHGEQPGPRHYYIAVGRQSQGSRWLVLDIQNLREQ